MGRTVVGHGCVLKEPTELGRSRMHSALWRQMITGSAPSQRLAAAVPILAEDDAATCTELVGLIWREEDRSEHGQRRARGGARTRRTLNVCGGTNDELSAGQLGAALLDGMLSFARWGI
ncbi:hypothetical protein THAOC_25783 [Thalassiosira oceanica]|uniref:Uncharacterized protein n=1 Tax=Thalassiosira oceanica TaxID=159749 RepID=K0S0H6_THAOC|nr:hypothetical protein THAOC_25783 [Thalassiosira oceanica]|eukprot:EJK54576.1 hypothetical protein THAOC_25783 [Thalassiosira oceanica]